MTAANYPGNRPRAYTRGRHYSRFQPLPDTARQKNQWLAEPKKTRIAKNTVESAKLG
jgi:hypothetical protein